MALLLAGATDALTAPSAAVNLNTGTFVMLCVPAFDGSESGVNRQFFDSDGARHAFWRGTLANICFMYNDGRQTAYNTSANWSAGDEVHLAFVYNKTGNVQQMWVDGVSQTQSSPSGTWGGTALGTNFHIAERFAAGFGRFDGDVLEIATYSAALSGAEIGMLAKRFSPIMVRPDILISYWASIRDEKIDRVGGNNVTFVGTPAVSNHLRVYYPAPTRTIHVPAAVAAFTMVADSGVYSLAGSAIAPSIKMPAASGVYAKTGSAIAPKISMPGASGTYNIVGSDILPAIKMPASSGVYSLVGSAALTQIGMPAAFGLYDLAGSAILTKIGLPAASGVYALVGSDTNLLKGFVLLAESGVYNLVGSDIAIDFIMVAESGVYTVTGSSVTLIEAGDIRPLMDLLRILRLTDSRG